MSEFLMEDHSATTIVESPNEALQPRAVKYELSGLILGQPDLVVNQAGIPDFKLPSLFQQSIFTNTVDKKASPNECGVIEQQDFKFCHTMQIQPPRSSTLDEALTLQISKMKLDASVSYRTVSETIIHTICEVLDNSSENASLLIKDSKTMDKIAQIIQEFVSTNFVIQTNQQRQEVNFVSTQPRSQVKSLKPDKTALDFYADILPINLVERAKEKFHREWRSFTRCAAVTLKKERCRNKSNLNESALDALVQELSSIPKPRDFSKVTKILLDIADMVFCTGVHLKKARFAIHDLCEHFYKNTNSPSREIELKCFDQWLRKLGQDEELKRESLEVKEKNNGTTEENILPKGPPLISNGADTTSFVPIPQSKGGVTNTMATNGLFLFEDRFGLEKSGFKNEEFTFAPNLTHKTLQLYNWAIKKHELTAAKLVDQILRQPLTKTDRKQQGYIYVYRHVEAFGFVKIGRSISVEGRLEGWEMQCRYLIDERKDLLRGIDRQAPHPKRLEDLIHAELKEKRYQVSKCEHCGKKHVEWFKVDAAEAQRVVEKWTLWMQKEPYNEDGKFKSGETEVPTVGNCELKPTLAARKYGNSRSKSDRRSSNQRQSKAASQKKPLTPSTHHMSTRSKVSLS